MRNVYLIKDENALCEIKNDNNKVNTKKIRKFAINTNLM